MTAGVACGSCGTGLRENSKFCNECGAPVTQVSRSAEYKQVTVLFADVVHSIDIAAALDMGAVARGHDRVGGALGGGSAPRRPNGTVICIWVIWLA
jgi:class 3 adenylate cyclase